MLLLPTQVLPVQRLRRVDGRQGHQTSLHTRPPVPGQFVHPLYHLLLPVDPVQVVPQDRQSRRLQDAGVLQDNPIGSWGGGGGRSETS